MKRITFFLIMALFSLSFVNVSASASVQVNSEQELLDAIADSTTEKIELASDITVQNSVELLRELSIDGKGFTITFQGDIEGWDSNYVLHAYKTKVTLTNISLTGGDAGLLVNGSEVTLNGAVDVSGNEFGGIEVAQGSGVDIKSKLIVIGTLENTDENAFNPTIWLDKVEQGTVDFEGVTQDVVDGKVYIFTDKNNSPYAHVSNQAELEAAAAQGASKIIFDNDITTAARIQFESDVEIIGNGHTLEFTRDAVGWDSNYVLQFYKVNAEVSDLNIVGGDASILVNGSTVVLNGNITLSGYEFGGIEVAQGTGVTTEAKLEVVGTLVGLNKSYSKPTVWKGLEDVTVVFEGASERVDDNGQTYYFEDQSSDEANVSNETELLAAIANAEIKVINLLNDIQTTQVIVVERDLSLNGDGNKLSLTGDVSGWNSNYVLHVYDAEVSISNIALTGGDAGLLINASEVTLLGAIDLSGNEFGGAEISIGHGFGVEEKSTLILGADAVITNVNETPESPTFWLDISSIMEFDLVSIQNIDKNAYFDEDLDIEGDFKVNYYIDPSNEPEVEALDLEALIVVVEEAYALIESEDLFEEESIEGFDDAYINAVAVLALGSDQLFSQIITQDMVDEVTVALVAAIDKLVPYPGVPVAPGEDIDASALYKLLEDNVHHFDNKDVYTQESFAAFEEAYNEAHVLALATKNQARTVVTQDMIDKATLKLETAVKGLVEVDKVVVVPEVPETPKKPVDTGISTGIASALGMITVASGALFVLRRKED